MLGFYQVYGRDNDPFGNAQRMIFVYNERCDLIAIYHVGTSQRSNAQLALEKLGYLQIHSVHLTIKEFNETKRVWKGSDIFHWAD